MTSDQDLSLTVAEAELFLKSFTCVDVESIISEDHRCKIRAALQVVVRASDYQMLGVCAPSLSLGLGALRSYLLGIGYDQPLIISEEKDQNEPVYIKFHSLKGSYYVDAYNGVYRGVLISCQSAFADGINATFGHFPLDLFSEYNGLQSDCESKLTS